MKKTRLVSLLLAALMTVSSLPFVAPISVAAASAETVTVTVGENLLDGITPTGNIATRQRDAGSIGNGYLHVGARADRWYGLGYNFNTTFEVGETYFLSFDLRASAATFNRQSKAWPMGREDIRVYGNVKQTNGKYNSGTDKTDYTYWDISRLTKNELGATYKDRVLYIANDYKSSATEYKFYTKNWDVVTSDSTSVLAVDYYDNKEWRNYEIMLQNVTEKNENAFISFVGGAGSNFAGPFDIDNIRLYTRVGDVSTGAIETEFTADYHNFDGAAPNIVTTNDKATTKGAFLISQYNTRSAASKGAVVTRIYNDTGFTEVPVTTEVKREAATVTENTFVKYNTSNIVLAPGTYRLSGEFRDGYYNKVKDNTMTLTPKLNYNGNITTLGTTQLSNEWTLASYEITVTEETKLTDVTFYANEQQTLQFKNVSLQRVYTPTESEKTTNGNTYTVSSADAINGATVTFGGGTYEKTEPTGNANGFLTVEPRNADVKWDLFVVNINKPVTKGQTYYVGFNSRVSVDVPQISGITLADTNTRIRVSTSGSNYEYGSGYVKSTGNNQYAWDTDGIWHRWNIGKNADWGYYEARFTPINNLTTLKLSIFRGVSSERAPIDIDNLVIWYYDDNGDKQIYFERNFDSIDGAYIGTGTEQFISNGTLRHSFDETYYTAVAETGKSPVANFALANNATVPGIYNFNVDLRTTQYLWKGSVTNPAAEVALNESKATVRFEFNDGTYVDHIANIDSMWSNVNTTVVIPDGKTIKNVSITTDYTTTALDHPSFDYRDISLTIERPATVRLPRNAYETANGVYFNITSSDELNGATVRFPDMTASRVYPKSKVNGYVTIPDRSTVVGALMGIDLGENAVNGRTYYIGFDARMSAQVPADPVMPFRVRTITKTNEITIQFNNKESGNEYPVSTYYSELQDTMSGAIHLLYPTDKPEWQYYEGQFTPKDADNDPLNLVIQRGVGSELHPLDIDNLKIWYYGDDYNEVVLYSNDFDDRAQSPIGTKNDAKKLYKYYTNMPDLIHSFDEYYFNALPEVDAAPTVKVELASDKAGAGIYKFTADVRVPVYQWKVNDTATPSVNTRGVKVVFNMTGGKTATVQQQVNVMWGKISAPVIVPEGARIESIEIVGLYNRTSSLPLSLDMKHMALVQTTELEFADKVEDADNLLNNAAVKYTDGGIVKKNVTDADNGYLSAAPLKVHSDNTVQTSLFNLALGENVVPGATYYVSFKIRSSVPVDNRSTANSNVIFIRDQSTGNGLVTTTDSELQGTTGGKASDNGQTAYPGDNTWRYFEATFNPTTGLIFWGRRGFGNETAPADIDDFKVWYVKDGETVTVYENSFDNPYASPIGTPIANTTVVDAFMKGDSFLVHNFDEAYSTMYTTSGQAPYIEYDVSGANIGEGAYKFTVDMRMSDYVYFGKTVDNIKTAVEYNTRKATVTYTYTDGTTSTAVTSDIVSVWNKLDVPVVVEAGKTLDKIVITTDVEELRSVDVKNPSLVKDYTYADIVVPDTSGLENLADDAKISYAGNAKKIDAPASANGYLSVEPRKTAVDILYRITLDEKIDPNKTYYVSYDIRGTVPLSGFAYTNRLITNCNNEEYTVDTYANNYAKATANNGVTIKKEYANNDKNYPMYMQITPADGEWTHYEAKFTPVDSSNTSQNLALTIQRGPSKEIHPVDIDNFKVWYYDANGDEMVIFSENFDDESKTYTGGANDVSKFFSQGTLVHDMEEEYTRVTPTGGNAAVTYDLSELNTEFGEGIYFFDAELRVGEYVYDNPWAGYSGINDREASVTFNLKDIDDSDGTNHKTVSVTKDVTVMWKTLQFPAIVPKGYELTDFSITAKYTGVALDVKNIKLSSQDFPIVEADEDEEEINYLDGVTMYVDNTAPIEVNNSDTAYLTVGQRTAGAQNFLTIPLNVAMKKDQTYYISMKIRGTDGVSTQVRPKYEPGNADSITDPKHLKEAAGDTNHPVIKDVGMNADFIVPADSMISSDICVWSPVQDSDAKFPITKLSGDDWTIFEGYFTPNQDVPASKSRLVIERGPNSAYVQPIDVDDIVIWTDAGEVYRNGFESDADMNGITSKATVSRVVPVNNYLELTPLDASEKMTITYNLDLTQDEAVEGKYTFKVSVKAAEESDPAPTARVLFIYDDGTVDSHVMTIGNEWTYIGKSDRLGRTPNLETIQIIIDSDVTVLLTKPVLHIQYKYKYGRPNTGIVMVLLKKIQGKMEKPKLVEYLPAGDFETVEPTIHNEAVKKSMNEMDEGFWAKLTAANPTKLLVVTEKGNTFVRVTDLDAGQRGIWYNTGVTLQPGNYTFSVDLRVSETETDNNYTAYTWHNTAKDWMYMRTILQNPDDVGSGNYAVFVAVDRDTAINKDGYATGYQSKVTREWTTYTDTITVTKPTTVIFKIGGGMSGQPDSHGFDIDNVSLKGYVYADGSTGFEVEEAVNLIENGDFAKAPTVIDGDKYNASKKNSWFRNNGMDYKYDSKGQPIKTQPMINHNQKITWNEEGYITVSGREFNMRQIWYNTGLTLKAGAYKFSVDFKTANAGETSSVRVSADGLFSAAAADAIEIKSDAWVTKTVTFTVTKDTALKLNFFGGPGVGFIHDYCIDNIVLEKLS